MLIPPATDSLRNSKACKECADAVHLPRLLPLLTTPTPTPGLLRRRRLLRRRQATTATVLLLPLLLLLLPLLPLLLLLLRLPLQITTTATRSLKSLQTQSPARSLHASRCTKLNPP